MTPILTQHWNADLLIQPFPSGARLDPRSAPGSSLDLQSHPCALHTLSCWPHNTHQGSGKVWFPLPFTSPMPALLCYQNCWKLLTHLLEEMLQTWLNQPWTTWSSCTKFEQGESHGIIKGIIYCAWPSEPDRSKIFISKHKAEDSNKFYIKNTNC